VSPAVLLLEGASDAVRALTLGEWVARWHEFYLMAGTAAVTLAGLLFVALSLHLDRLVQESHEHVLALARVTLLSFTMVLFASMFMLVPATSKRQTAVMLGTMGIGGLVVLFRVVRAARHHDEAGFSRGQMRRRLMFPAIGYVMMILTAIGIGLGIPDMLYMMVGAVCMILGNAAGTSWDLLVQIARQRRNPHPNP
jgi:hypothetical protein